MDRIKQDFCFDAHFMYTVECWIAAQLPSLKAPFRTKTHLFDIDKLQ